VKRESSPRFERQGSGLRFEITAAGNDQQSPPDRRNPAIVSICGAQGRLAGTWRVLASKNKIESAAPCGGRVKQLAAT